ncbi:hypothetical protein AGMMS49940_06190 [Spirochaetia bacterium]|nr:hypothetical protein AGMMS49940_06190 [Spirochaetia bacterium]
MRLFFAYLLVALLALPVLAAAADQPSQESQSYATAGAEVFRASRPGTAADGTPPPRPAAAAPPLNRASSRPAAAADMPSLNVIPERERELPSLFSDTSNPELYNPLPVARGRQPPISSWASLAPSPPGDMERVIHFAAGQDQFLPTEYYRLDTLAAMLKRLPQNALILVDGHTAPTGSFAGDMDLSFRRAQGLVEALKSRGINENRLFFRTWGCTHPLVSNDTNTGRSLNNRVEITILNGGEPLP